jgi:hypothetical protein
MRPGLSWSIRLHWVSNHKDLYPWQKD